MKNKFWLLFFVISIGLLASGCRRKNITEIPHTVYVEIPAGLNVLLTHHFPITGVINTPTGAEIISAQPTFMRLTRITGEPNLDFIRHAYLDAVKDGVPTEMGYYIDAPLAGSQKLDLLSSIIEMKEHVSQPTFDMELKLVFRAITTDITQLRIDFNIRIEEEGE